MNCWKTINLSRDLGNQRLLFISLLVMLMAFIMMFLPLSIINENITLNDDYSLLFLICLLLLIPIRVICQALPAWMTGRRVSVKIGRNSRLLGMKIEFNQSLSRNVKIFSILSPTLLITCPLVGCSIIFPEFMHYLSIVAAFNIGLSVSDIIYLSILIKAPKQSVVEHTNQSLDILIRENRL